MEEIVLTVAAVAAVILCAAIIIGRAADDARDGKL